MASNSTGKDSGRGKMEKWMKRLAILAKRVNLVAKPVVDNSKKYQDSAKKVPRKVWFCVFKLKHWFTELFTCRKRLVRIKKLLSEEEKSEILKWLKILCFSWTNLLKFRRSNSSVKCKNQRHRLRPAHPTHDLRILHIRTLFYQQIYWRQWRRKKAWMISNDHFPKLDALNW